MTLLAPLLLYAPMASAPLLGNDTPVWVEEGQVTSLSEIGGLLKGPHFIFFRPFAALSFAIGSRPGQELWAHAVDFTAFYAVLLAFVIAVRQAFALRWSILVPMTLILGGQPVVEELFLSLARRADFFVTMFGLLYASSVLRGGHVVPRLVFLAGALASKEPAFILPLAAALHALAASEGPLHRRLFVAGRRTSLDFVILLIFLALRFWSLSDLGGNQDSIRSPHWYLIPVDFVATILLPHGWGMWQVHPAIPCVVAAAVLALFGRLLRRGLHPATALLLGSVVLEAALYTTLSIWQPRRVMMATFFVGFWYAERISSSGPRTCLPVGLLLVPIAVLHLWTAPWARFQALADHAQEYLTALEREVALLPEPALLFLAEAPASYRLPHGARRVSFSYPDRVSRNRIPLLEGTYLIKEIRRLRHPGRRLTLRTVFRVELLGPDAEYECRFLDPEDPEELVLEVRCHEAVVLPERATYGIAEKTEDGWLIDLESSVGSRLKRPGAVLFAGRAEEGDRTRTLARRLRVIERPR